MKVEMKVTMDFNKLLKVAVRADFPLNKVPDKQTFTVNEVHKCIFGLAWLYTADIINLCNRTHRMLPM